MTAVCVVGGAAVCLMELLVAVLQAYIFTFLTTLFLARPGLGAVGLIILGLAIGGGIGAFIARRIAMPAPFTPAVSVAKPGSKS